MRCVNLVEPQQELRLEDWLPAFWSSKVFTTGVLSGKQRGMPPIMTVTAKVISAMVLSDEELRRAAKSRVACLFNVSLDTLALDIVFGEGLKVSFVSDFKANEFDQLDYDIRDVADRQILKELSSGILVIQTVGDYCEHMVRCYRTKPEEVIRVLFK